MFGCKYGVVIAATVTFALPVAAQFEKWTEGQINTTMCYWGQLRAALLGDTIYLDGGSITWKAGLNSGEISQPFDLGNLRGRVLTYNLTRPFSSNDNMTGMLLKDDLTKLGTGGFANARALNFEDGGMLANYDQFFLYGGLDFDWSPIVPPSGSREVIAYGSLPGQPSQASLFTSQPLPEDLTRYVSSGAAVNAPSEKLSWYFSGLMSPSKGIIFSNAVNDSNRATKVSDRMITLDTTLKGAPEWGNSSISSTKARAGAEAVWVPVGEKGILVVLGGVIAPHWVDATGPSRDPEKSEKESPIFMQDIDIYDVKADKWYKQKTTGGPKTRTRGCAVVASASDYSSHNIYYYGGYDGLKDDGPFHDDVWVLSLPSFTWVQLNRGKDRHARAGHKCLTPYPDQMMVFGGMPSMDYRSRCLDDGPIVNFNMTSGEWLDSYDPTQWSEYGVPEKVFEEIGGTAAGGAEKTKPDSDWDSDALGAIFGKEYDHRKIETFYPYPLEPSASTRPEAPPGDSNDGGKKGGTPSWLAPVLGVVIGLILLTLVIVLFCFWRRRKALKKGPSDPGTEDAGMRIMSWMRGQQAGNAMEVKAATITTTEEMPASHEYGHQRSLAVSPAPPTVYSGYSRYEMDDTQVMELDANTLPPELHHNTGFTHLGMASRPNNNASPAGSTSLSKPSSVSGDNDLDDAISQASGPISGNNAHVAHGTPIVDSPTLAVESPGVAELNARVTSDISILSRASHLRNLSDATVSSEGTQIEPRPAVARTSHPGVLPIPEASESPVEERGSGIPKKDSGVLPFLDTPVSPPTADDAPGDDYISARPTLVSPISKAPWEDDLSVLK